ncbi:MAG: hypothetical protein AABY22_21505 [Nanoarchaeota archaeon]
MNENMSFMLCVIFFIILYVGGGVIIVRYLISYPINGLIVLFILLIWFAVCGLISSIIYRGLNRDTVVDDSAPKEENK